MAFKTMVPCRTLDYNVCRRHLMLFLYGSCSRGVLTNMREKRKASGLSTFSVSHLQRLRSEMLHALPKVMTPYGRLVQRATIQGKGGEMTFEFLSPQALLHHASVTCKCFGPFLEACAGRAPHNVLNVVVYVDKATPGNDKRYDEGRASDCIYWTLLEYPRWYRARLDGWAVLAYPTKFDMHAAGVTDSMLLRWAVSVFFGSRTWCLNTVGIRINVAGRPVKLRCRFSSFLADFEAHQYGFSFKGAAASVPCPMHRNVMGRCAYFEGHHSLVHLHAAEHDKMQPRTHQELMEIADQVEAAALAHDDAALKTRQQLYGVKYDPDAILWDRELRAITEPPERLYADWMHSGPGSGGTGQYVLNRVCIDLEAAGVELKSIDEWVKENVVLMKGLQMPRQFFEKCVVRRLGRCCRGFASDVLTATMALRMFLEVVVQPLNIAALATPILLIVMLDTIYGILQRADITDAPAAQEAWRAFHKLLLQYCPEVVKFKCHWMDHVFQCWMLHGELLACWQTERKHKSFVRTLQFAYRQAASTALAIEVRRVFGRYLQRDTFRPWFLVQPTHAVQCTIATASGASVAISRWSLAIACPRGTLRRTELLWWMDGATRCCGIAFGYVEGTAADGAEHFGAIVYQCVPTLRLDWWHKQEAHKMLLPACLIGGALAYVRDGCFIRPHFPC